MDPVRAVLWDLDGTLLDTESLSSDAIQAVVEPFGKTFTWSTKEKILGMRGEEWARIVLSDLGLEGQMGPAEMVKEWEEHLELLTPEVRKCPGAARIISYFHHMANLPMAIATSSSTELVRHKRQRHEDLFSLMRLVVTGDDPEVLKGKPSPDIYLVAAKRLGVEPKHCLVFEDALTGVRSGKAAGMKVVAVPDPRLDPAPFLAEADQVLASLEAFDPQSWGLPPFPTDNDTADGPQVS